MLTPSDLAQQVPARTLTPSVYDWQENSRGADLLMAYTTNSIQTFDSKGKPNDAKSDQTD